MLIKGTLHGKKKKKKICLLFSHYHNPLHKITNNCMKDWSAWSMTERNCPTNSTDINPLVLYYKKTQQSWIFVLLGDFMTKVTGVTLPKDTSWEKWINLPEDHYRRYCRRTSVETSWAWTQQYLKTVNYPDKTGFTFSLLSWCSCLYVHPVSVSPFVENKTQTIREIVHLWNLYHNQNPKSPYNTHS